MPLTGYLAPVDLEHELRDEMAAAGRHAVQRPHGRLVISDAEPIQSAFADNVWRDAERIPITSIGHAAKELRDRQRNWAMYAPVHGGRAKLIAGKLPRVGDASGRRGARSRSPRAQPRLTTARTVPNVDRERRRADLRCGCARGRAAGRRLFSR